MPHSFWNFHNYSRSKNYYVCIQYPKQKTHCCYYYKCISLFLVVHIWCYDSFESMTEAKQKLGVDEEWTTLRRSRSKLLNSRGNQVLMAFTYWQPQFDHLSKKIFELRSYTLKVGSGSPDPQVISMVTMIYIHTVYMVLMLIWCLVKQLPLLANNHYHTIT